MSNDIQWIRRGTYQIDLDDLIRERPTKGFGIVFCGHLGIDRRLASDLAKLGIDPGSIPDNLRDISIRLLFELIPTYIGEDCGDCRTRYLGYERLGSNIQLVIGLIDVGSNSSLDGVNGAQSRLSGKTHKDRVAIEWVGKCTFAIGADFDKPSAGFFVLGGHLE